VARERTLIAWKMAFEARPRPGRPRPPGILRAAMATHADEQIDRALNILGDVAANPV
jgi:hypothetical protein